MSAQPGELSKCSQQDTNSRCRNYLRKGKQTQPRFARVRLRVVQGRERQFVRTTCSPSCRSQTRWSLPSSTPDGRRRGHRRQITYEHQKPRELTGSRSGGAQKRNVALATAIKSPTPIAVKNLVGSKPTNTPTGQHNAKMVTPTCAVVLLANAAGNMFVPPDSATWRTAHCGFKRPTSCSS